MTVMNGKKHTEKMPSKTLWLSLPECLIISKGFFPLKCFDVFYLSPDCYGILVILAQLNHPHKDL